MLASGLVLGVLAGLAVGRSFRNFSGLRVRWLPLLIAALAARAVAPFFAALALPIYVFSLAGTAAAAAANRELPGALLIAAGGALNLAVVLLNGGMPIDPAALTVAGAASPTDSLHVAWSAGIHLSVLADVIPVAPVRSVYSIGDFLVAIGGFLIPYMVLSKK